MRYLARGLLYLAVYFTPCVFAIFLLLRFIFNCERLKTLEARKAKNNFIFLFNLVLFRFRVEYWQNKDLQFCNHIFKHLTKCSAYRNWVFFSLIIGLSLESIRRLFSFVCLFILQQPLTSISCAVAVLLLLLLPFLSLVDHNSRVSVFCSWHTLWDNFVFVFWFNLALHSGCIPSTGALNVAGHVPKVGTLTVCHWIQ